MKDILFKIKKQLIAFLNVWQKRIRRPLESYTKTTPPHIRAARLLPRPVKVIRYVITELGPEPVGFVKGQLNYEHYQLWPNRQAEFDDKFQLRHRCYLCSDL